MNIKYYLKNQDKLEEKYLFFINKKLLLKIEPSTILIEARIKKAEHNLKMLNQLDNEFNDWKIISLYYSLYHSSLALLAKEGYSSKNHTATLIFLLKKYTQITDKEINLIDELQLKEEDAKFYTSLKQERHNANYSTNLFYDDKKILKLKKKTIQFLNKVKEIIKN